MTAMTVMLNPRVDDVARQNNNVGLARLNFFDELVLTIPKPYAMKIRQLGDLKAVEGRRDAAVIYVIFSLDYNSVAALFDGLNDIAPIHAVSGKHKNDSTAVRSKMNAISDRLPAAAADTYSILLFHRNNLLDDLFEYKYSLVFSGHGHGGLIRIPFAGGIISPDGNLDLTQKYTGGMYTQDNTTFIISRGMAGSHNFPRLFNRPEIVSVTLHHTD